jgi:hypothetical protein
MFLDDKAMTTAQSNVLQPLFGERGLFFVQNMNEPDAL